MQYPCALLNKRFWILFSLVLTSLTSHLLISCATVKEEPVLDRTTIPEVKTDVPITESEVREIKFHTPKSEKGHQVMHLRGLIFTKMDTAGSIRIKPCNSCSVKLLQATDTSAYANSTTGYDGYFTFNGATNFRSIIVTNPGYNQVEIQNVVFDVGGINTIKIILAPGNTREQFTAIKTGTVFTWNKLKN